MSHIMENAELMLTGLIKDLKESHKRITEYEAHIARERQLISAKIEAHQAKLAFRRVQRKALAPHEPSASLSAVSIQMAS